jgi:hypothetical protein
LGNGASSFWYDIWSEFGKLCDHVWYVDIHDTHLTVADIFRHGTWNLSQLYTHLPENILESISKISLCLNENISDGYTWKGNLDGIYSAKAGYSWVRNSTSSETSLGYSWIKIYPLGFEEVWLVVTSMCSWQLAGGYGERETICV